jgi:hypothetical protein
MNRGVSTLLKQARDARETEALYRACLLYQQAADLCALSQNLSDRAFALRHTSDLNRELGRFGDALAIAQEAESIYRNGEGNGLDLANCLRLVALAHMRLDDESSALPFWQEAMQLYSQSGVDGGVAECEYYLGL